MAGDTHQAAGDPAAATRLAVINTVTGQLTVLPALALPSGLVELASWQPGDTHLAIAAVRLPAGTTPVLGDHE